MLDTAKQRMIQETTQRRDEALTLLRSLLDAKSISERNLAQIHQPDLIKQVTGKSSMDNAISSTRRLIDSFNRVLDDLRRNLTEEDLELIGSIEPNIATG
jgi:predicted translin family RNA/ssDNA-binding protein